MQLLRSLLELLASPLARRATNGDVMIADVVIAQQIASAEFAVTCKLEPNDTVRAYEARYPATPPSTENFKRGASNSQSYKTHTEQNVISKLAATSPAVADTFCYALAPALGIAKLLIQARAPNNWRGLREAIRRGFGPTDYSLALAWRVDLDPPWF
jgi:hypothetical protein